MGFVDIAQSGTMAVTPFRKLTTASGTTRTSRDVRFCAVIGGIADIKSARYEHSDLWEVVEALVDDGASAPDPG